jgi:spermidine/putrescine transport system substrate-binding protein
MSAESPKITSTPVSRRSFMAAIGGAGAVSLLGLETLSGSENAAGASQATVRWANWSLYLDYDNKSKKYPTLEAFTRKTGIPAKYLEVIDDNDSFTAKVSPQIRLKKDIGYDVVTMTEWMAARWVASGYVQKFDDAAIPNKKNVLPFLANRPFDPGRHLSLPWAGIIAGLAWNKKHTPKGIHTIDQLFAKANKGKIEVLSEMRDTIGLVMLWQGVDISKPFTEDKFMNAVDYVTKMIHDGFIRQIKGQSYQEDLISGDATAVIGWSGDINQLNLQNSNQFGFAIPESGGTFSTDNLMIPVTSKNKKGAEALINYYYDPIVAAKVANYITYICPVGGAQDAMAKINPKQVHNPLIFPDDAMWKKLKVFRPLTPAEQIKFSTAFQKASGNG